MSEKKMPYWITMHNDSRTDLTWDTRLQGVGGENDEAVALHTA